MKKITFITLTLLSLIIYCKNDNKTESDTEEISGLTDAEAVATDAASLDFADFAFAPGDSENSVKENFTLPVSGLNGTTINWLSDNGAVVITDGSASVTRPAYGTGSVTVILTADVIKNDINTMTYFSIIVEEALPVTKDQLAYSVDTVSFNMRYVAPGTFYTGGLKGGIGVVTSGYMIAETEVTYELWYKVVSWAKTDTGGGAREDGGPLYSFQNLGREGHNGGDGSAPTTAKQEPVTFINWRDAMIFTNALTEYYNWKNGTTLEPVYCSDEAHQTPIRSSIDGSYSATTNYPNPGSFDDPYVNPSAMGFRMPTHDEWELAAKFIDDINQDGAILEAGEYYPFDHISGDSSNDVRTSTEIDQYCWHLGNSGLVTKTVGTKLPNALGLYDMCGNVWEWTYDWYLVPHYPAPGKYRAMRGGSYSYGKTLLNYKVSTVPYAENDDRGLRLVKTETLSSCGNGIVDTGEICDDGNTMTETQCSYTNATCALCNTTCDTELNLTGSYCGDDIVDETETCDDGNTIDGDGCESVCHAHMPGFKQAEIVDAITFNMVYVPPKTFPIGQNDLWEIGAYQTVDHAFFLGETEVTYELWSAVLSWAQTEEPAGSGTRADGGELYSFANQGYMGDGSNGTPQHPVTYINWRDAMVFSNALTEYYNALNSTSLQCVYTTDVDFTNCIRTSTNNTTFSYGTLGTEDDPYVNPDAKGFRLPTNNEWELAERYAGDFNHDGDILDEGEYYPGTHVSGDLSAPIATSLILDNYAWHSGNSGSKSHEVATRQPNALGIYDMSGNVWEHIFDWSSGSQLGTHRINRGGSYYNPKTTMYAYIYYSLEPFRHTYNYHGFRLARSE
ncbi:MAG: SUMF1/EgtB/PvdO family nonheme iron enzyme [Spirochaetia bacterium]|nr:SUMF1/EgtB/PvdO family nonheme iron enzyme [Spirochaetia bacterium]